MAMEHSTAMGYANVFPLRAPMWEDLRVPATAVRVSGTKPPAWTDYKGSLVLAFGDEAVEGNEEVIYFVAQIPHSYVEGSDVEVHVHWVGEDNSAGNVAWKFTHSWASINGVFPGETTVMTPAANSLVTDNQNYKSIVTMDGTGKGISSMLLCSLKRNSSNAADTFTGKSAYLLEVDFHYQLDTPGSQLIASK